MLCSAGALVLGTFVIMAFGFIRVGQVDLPLGVITSVGFIFVLWVFFIVLFFFFLCLNTVATGEPGTACTEGRKAHCSCRYFARFAS